MAKSLYACRTYKIEYEGVGVSGWDQCDKFVQFLREKSSDYDGIWFNEAEDEIEVEFSTLRKLKRVTKWSAVIQKIIDTADHSNSYARLSIF
jgi:hypothetical protein